jgi:glycerophosphoryl diester phosphodiesterase
MLRVGHRGAAALAAPNSIASVRAALAAGVDMIEIDLCPGLIVAHDRNTQGERLEGFLEGLSDVLPADIEIMLDLKTTGYERQALRACEHARMLERTLFATLERSSVRLLAGDARTSFSYNRRSPGGAAALLRGLAPRAWRRSSAVDATIRYSLASPALLDTVHERGGRVFAWTVNNTRSVERMKALGVDGIITDDPRLLNG